MSWIGRQESRSGVRLWLIPDRRDQFPDHRFRLYLLIRAMNKLMANPAAAPAAPPPTHEEILLAEIRDLLARKA